MRVLIETRMNSLRLTESKTPKKGCLGRLEGVCADFKNPTRNGRKYPLGLWKKVFEDSLFKESLENKTLFGELDHPEDRFEPLISEACVVMTDYKIDENAGLIYGGFDILDTPKGRILKNILDYGSVVGVSSRGQGDIIESVDGECVDEDSYEFACFDVVSTPAVAKARQQVTESIKKINIKNFTESVRKQIDDAETVADLNIIRSVVRTSKLNESEIDSLIESIEDKCKMLQNVEETILTESSKKSSDDSITESAKTIRDNKKLYKCIKNLKEQVSAYKYRDKRYAETVNSLNSEISTLKSKVGRLQKESMKTKNQQKNLTENLNRRLDAQRIQAENELENYEKLVESLKRKNGFLKEQLHSEANSSNELLDKAQKSIESKSNEISKLNEMLRKSNDRVDYLENQIETMSKTHESDIASMDVEVEDYTKLLSEAQQKIDTGNSTIKELKESLSNATKTLQSERAISSRMKENLKKYQESYLKKASTISGIDPKSVESSVKSDTSPEQIDSLVEAMRDRIDRHNRLGIAKRGIETDKDYIVNSSNNNPKESADDDRLISFLNTARQSL